MNTKKKQQKKRSKKAFQKKRSQAQIEASRNNGRKSKGPKTQAGKAISSLNALKHGLTAKFLKPARDMRRDDELFDYILEELIKEYKPNCFTANTTVAHLAHDYVQLTRCRQMMEALQKPKALPPYEKKQWEALESEKKFREQLAAAIDRITANEDLDFPLKVARQLASKVANLVKQTRQDFEEINEATKEGPANIDDLLPFQDCEVQEINELWGIMKPCCRKLADEEHLTRLFGGQALISRPELNCLREILNYLEQNSAQRISTYRGVENMANTLMDNALYFLAQEPKGIMLLERYLRDIELSIERKMKQL